ncbi:Hsp70 family protein [Talaromyces stipitatus ATCC 10500]|uniref:Hsp70 family protein n=1 Tax=Talaromyces stipitatus (strain ATCC 10500 / CBS 375.48 / QM 6759 / NRRL 1006) TaxID=441959 RepID=B8LYZ9_TALSN|nr:Hsp70 family protein [Talaromyces stipitatus ATCC 10500]EED23507.1 Hsp70 family protein [Talaromyces stipitatus ATCC 10500]
MAGAEDLSKGLTQLSLGVDSHKIIVGVDYGTTYTGLSYVSTEKKDINDIVVVNTWPGPARDADHVEKAPSRIAYPNENTDMESPRWGYQVEPGMTAYSWTKLLLEQRMPLGGYEDQNLEVASKAGIMKLPEGKTAVQVVADFLTEIRDHARRILEKRITEKILAATPLEFWLTIPAIWSESAKNATREAALLAGFEGSSDRPKDRIFMITEPEAAAVAAIRKSIHDGMGDCVKPEDGVLICDCGGGTVDITTYLISETSPQLVFEELCTGIGGKCGSTAIDRNLYALMSERFGNAFDEIPLKRKGPGSEFMNKFERVKRDFGFSKEDKINELRLKMNLKDPDPTFYDEEETFVLLSNNDLRKMFDPIIKQIIELLQQQIEDANREAEREAINRIILVGGFGDSYYLRQELVKHFESAGRITITVPDNPQSVIVRGAALRGLEGIRPKTRRSRRHYGFQRWIPFREGTDSELDARTDPFTGLKMVSGIMKWMIAKGEKYVDNYNSDPHNLKILHFEGDSLRKHLLLFSCDLRDAPERYDSDKIEHVGMIVVDFRNVDLAQFEKKKVNGIETTVLQYAVKVVFGAEEGVLKFLVIANDAVIGTANIDFSQKTTISQVHVPRSSSQPRMAQKSLEYRSPKKDTSP